jgi:uncharacterized membrane protein YdjX (TVP38/TMEM64 family)
MKTNKLILLTTVVVLITLFFYFDLLKYLSLEYFQAQRQAIVNYYDTNPWQTLLIYFVIYLVVTGLSLPGATVLTLIAGAVFGFVRWHTHCLVREYYWGNHGFHVSTLLVQRLRATAV